MDLTGFKVFDFEDGVPYFSVTRNGLTFNKAVTRKLGYPEYARLLINPDTKQIALCTCEEGTPQSVPFYRKKDNGILSVRWNSRDLVATLERLMGTSYENHGYRVEGVPVDDSTMLFDLSAAKPLD